MPASSDTDARYDDPVFEGEEHDSSERVTADYDGDGDYADRTDTFIRILYTLLFFLVMRVVEAAVGVVVFFQLVFALVTNSKPNPAVNAFARRIIEYGYQIAHYVTYNRDQPPFPFDGLPDDPESERWESAR